jgi:hypothetical protein
LPLDVLVVEAILVTDDAGLFPIVKPASIALREGVHFREDVLPLERVSFGTVLFLVGDEEAGVVGFFAVFCVRGVDEAEEESMPAATMVRLGLLEGTTILVFVVVVFLPEVFLATPPALTRRVVAVSVFVMIFLGEVFLATPPPLARRVVAVSVFVTIFLVATEMLELADPFAALMLTEETVRLAPFAARIFLFFTAVASSSSSPTKSNASCSFRFAEVLGGALAVALAGALGVGLTGALAVGLAGTFAAPLAELLAEPLTEALAGVLDGVLTAFLSSLGDLGCFTSLGFGPRTPLQFGLPHKHFCTFLAEKGSKL